MTAVDWNLIENALKPIAEAKGVYLVGRGDRRERGRRIIQLYVDTDEGISIAQCAELSRELGGVLDGMNAVNEPYDLEVSSPGIDKPLTLLRQYRKNVGRKFKVAYRQGDDRKTLSGTLATLEEDRLTFVDARGASTTLEFSNIIESLEELPW
ncbi:MAG TPA: ribosome maturation factor RimP [Bacteroidota bacterium]|nr:ribosome maturation factor RimP [Bacteroidota bacterium]